MKRFITFILIACTALVSVCAGQVNTERWSSESVLADGKWVKISVSETGVYKLTHTALRDMGFLNPEKVRLFGYGGAAQRENEIYLEPDDLPEQPLWREKDYMLFFGQGPTSWQPNLKGEYEHKNNPYSLLGYYFLTDREFAASPKVFEAEEPSLNGGMVLDTFTEHVLFEKDEFSWINSGCQFFDSYDFKTGSTRRVNLATPSICKEKAVTLTLSFAGAAQNTQSLKVNLSDSQVAQLWLSGVVKEEVATAGAITKSLKGELFAENNTFELVYSDKGVSAHLDYIRLNYQRKLEFSGSYLFFRDGSTGEKSFRVARSNSNVVVWRVSDKEPPTLIPAELNSDTIQTIFVHSTPQDEFVAVDTKGAGFPQPKVVGRVENQNLHSASSVDMVILTPQSGKLFQEAERLAQAHRKYDGLSVVVVNVEQVYNEFSSGTPNATAYRRFLKMFYDRAGEGGGPRYLLLFGDGVWDNRMVTPEWHGGNPADYLLCYESLNSVSHTRSYVTDDYYCLLEDHKGLSLTTEKIDMTVGRLPVTESSQAKMLVDRIINHINGVNHGSWRNRMLLLGDDGDNNLHMTHAENVAEVVEKLYPTYELKKIYWDTYKAEASAAGYTYPSVRKSLLEELKKGALVVNYVGHGSADVLSHELVLSKTQALEFKTENPAFWVTASCDIAPFDGASSSFGENLLINKNGGAIGLLTTTRTVYAIKNTQVNTLFMENLFKVGDDGHVLTLGDAYRQTKLGLSGSSQDTENKLHFVLLADPALRLSDRVYNVVVDSFASLPADSKDLQVKAGQVVRVSGHVESADTLAKHFNGVVYSTVFDSERTITTLNNQDLADKPFMFKTFDKPLFTGEDSIRDGQFTFVFPVPLDISYSSENGRILLYAENHASVESANGLFENFTVGGTADSLGNDSVGPELSFYLNTPGFIYGGETNPTPLFAATIKDPDGINATGSGLGHSMLLVIDNNPHWTYVLNDSFSFDAADYTSGKVVFSIPELPEGEHELMFRAWDVMNNSTTRYLKFKVRKGLSPSVEVRLSDNPARERTTLTIFHDRPGNEVEIKVQVVDYGGRIHFEDCRNENSTDGYSLYEWNLMTNQGSRIPQGLYLVRVEITQGGSSDSCTTKLIVI